MVDDIEIQPRSARFRQAISLFIAEQREAKLKGKADENGQISTNEYHAWLAKAAMRVNQLQIVTHALKATHPYARGTNLYVNPADLPNHTEIGTHTLGDDFTDDVVGNAAALGVYKGVYKFLKIEVDGHTLLHWMQVRDPDLRQALHPDPNLAEEWMSAFTGLIRLNEQPVAHELAKQVYWLVGDEPVEDTAYHLLEPLFSSSLVHAVHQEIQDARFGDSNREAREAYRAGRPHEGVYRDYRGLAYRKLGGTNPQNISQLNVERRGINYLLASLPPHWKQRSHLNLRGKTSAFDVFFRYEGVRDQVKSLTGLLKENAEARPTMELRQARERIEQDLAASLAAFGAESRRYHPAGWSRDADCRLPLSECLWLDPGRVELPDRSDHPDHDQDREFREAYVRGDWPDEVALRFANWLNARLRSVGITAVGDIEARHWARQAVIDVAWPIPMRRRAGDMA